MCRLTQQAGDSQLQAGAFKNYSITCFCSLFSDTQTVEISCKGKNSEMQGYKDKEENSRKELRVEWGMRNNWYKRGPLLEKSHVSGHVWLFPVHFWSSSAANYTCIRICIILVQCLYAIRWRGIQFLSRGHYNWNWRPRMVPISNVPVRGRWSLETEWTTSFVGSFIDDNSHQ